MDEFRRQLQGRLAALRNGTLGLSSDGLSGRSLGAVSGTSAPSMEDAVLRATGERMGLCVGINVVDPTAYPGGVNTLHGCVNDARSFGRKLRAHGFSVAVLEDAAATRTGVGQELARAATRLMEGDLFVMLVSSHGGRQALADGKKHESWVLYDGLVWDEDIIAAFSCFRKGVRILIVNDQCHSGGVFLEKSFTESVPQVRNWNPASKSAGWTVERALASPDFPQLIQFAGCRAEQTSLDLGVGGAWTLALLSVLEESPGVSCRTWFNRAFAKLPRGEQDPQWIERGPVTDAFRDGRVLA